VFRGVITLGKPRPNLVERFADRLSGLFLFLVG
jgi:hypothetical protein